MSEHLTSRRWSWVATLIVALLLPQHAQAYDPPGLLAWFSEMTGTVTFSPAGTDTWIEAPANHPLTSGDRVWVDQGSHAEMHIGSTAIRLGAQTLLTFTTLNEDRLQLQILQGEVVLRVHTLFDGQVIELDTPNLTLEPYQTGLYRLDVSTDSGNTIVSVRDGQAVVYGDSRRSKTIDSGERIVYAGSDTNQYVMEGNPPIDSFDIWSSGRDQLEASSISARYVSRELIGYQSLDTYGTWVSDPAYGPVWVPHIVSVGWAPFHEGHWAWIDPWGWTWVDDAPWGFATCHYGRWAWANSHWFWVPGPRIARPVYAPALVAFVAERHGRGPGTVIHQANGSAGVAWVPLGPGEAYHPAFHAGPRYIAAINHMVPIPKSPPDHTLKYVNQKAPNSITVVTPQVFTHGQPVQSLRGSLNARDFGSAHFVHAPDIAPEPSDHVVAPTKGPGPIRAQSLIRSQGPKPQAASSPPDLPVHHLPRQQPVTGPPMASPTPAFVTTPPANQPRHPPHRTPVDKPHPEPEKRDMPAHPLAPESHPATTPRPAPHNEPHQDAAPSERPADIHKRAPVPPAANRAASQSHHRMPAAGMSIAP